MNFSLKTKLNILATIIFFGLAISLNSVFKHQLKRFELADEYIHDDRFYWYDGSVVTLAEDLDYLFSKEDSFDEIKDYLNKKTFKEKDNIPAIIALDGYYNISNEKATGALYLGFFESSFMLSYVSVIILFYLTFIIIINILIKKIEDSFKYVSQTAEDLNVINEHQIEEKKLLGYIQSFFDPIEIVSKSFLPKYKQESFKDNHKKGVKGFTDLINNYIKAKKEELLAQLTVRNETRNKIAADLHDDIGATLTKISNNSDIIKSSIDVSKVKLASEKIGHLSREMLLSFSDVIWAIDSQKDTMLDLVDHMYDLAYDLLPEEEIEVSFKADSFGPLQLNVEVRQNVYLIYKEVLNNIRKHSRAKLVEIEVNKLDDGFCLIIKDNGKGFDKKKIQKGNGLKNMHKRAENIKADLQIEINSGTIVSLKVL